MVSGHGGDRWSSHLALRHRGVRTWYPASKGCPPHTRGVTVLVREDGPMRSIIDDASRGGKANGSGRRVREINLQWQGLGASLKEGLGT